MKPRCQTCNCAMKSPYERIGAKGNWSSINNWWYCNSCNLMIKKPDVRISSDLSKYLDDELADKYPVIIKYRIDHNAQNLNLMELRNHIDDWQRYSGMLRKVNQKPSSKNKIELNNRIYHYHGAIWFCEMCKFLESADQLNYQEDLDLATLKRIQPTHCEQNMVLTILTQREVEGLYDFYKSLWFEQFEEKSSTKFLIYCLSLIENYYYQKLLNDFDEILGMIPELVDTYEYSLLQHLLSLFDIQNHKTEFWLTHPSRIPTTRLRIMTFEKEHRREIVKRTKSKFNDLKWLILKIPNLDPDEEFMILRSLWKIEIMIGQMETEISIPDYSTVIAKAPQKF